MYNLKRIEKIKLFFIFSSIAVILAVSVIFFVKANSNNDRIAYEISLENLEAITFHEDGDPLPISDCYNVGYTDNLEQAWVYLCPEGTSSSVANKCPSNPMSIRKGLRGICYN